MSAQKVWRLVRVSGERVTRYKSYMKKRYVVLPFFFCEMRCPQWKFPAETPGDRCPKCKPTGWFCMFCLFLSSFRLWNQEGLDFFSVQHTERSGSWAMFYGVVCWGSSMLGTSWRPALFWDALLTQWRQWAIREWWLNFPLHAHS